MMRVKVYKNILLYFLIFSILFTLCLLNSCKSEEVAEEKLQSEEEVSIEEEAEAEEEVAEPEPELEAEPEEEVVPIEEEAEEVITSCKVIGSCDVPGSAARRVQVEGDYAYVTDVKGLRIIDINDKENPYIAGNCNTPGFAIGVYIEGNYAYIADWDNGLSIIDINDKENPYIAGNCNTPGFAIGVYIEGNYAYIVDTKESGTYSGLNIIDISDKNNPHIISNCDTRGAWDIYVEGNHAYIAEVDDDLEIIDISNKENPYIIGNCNTPGSARDIFIEGNYAYIAEVDGGLLQILDISNKENPHIIGSCNRPGRGQSVYVEGNYAYIVDKDCGLHIVKISNKENPYIVASCDTPGEAESIYVEGDYAYVADYESGLTVIELLKSYDYEEPPQLEEEGGIIVLGGEKEGAYKGTPNFNYGAGGPYPLIKGYISWDIKQCHGKNIDYAEIAFDAEEVFGDLSLYGPLLVEVVGWGKRPITMEDFYLEGELIASSDEANFKIDGDSLKEELQKAFDEGGTRFQIMLYFDFQGESSGDYLVGVGYKYDDVRLSIFYKEK